MEVLVYLTYLVRSSLAQRICGESSSDTWVISFFFSPDWVHQLLFLFHSIGQCFQSSYCAMYFDFACIYCGKLFPESSVEVWNNFSFNSYCIWSCFILLNYSFRTVYSCFRFFSLAQRYEIGWEEKKTQLRLCMVC